MRIRPGVHLANCSDVGQEREENEDYFAYFEPEEDEQFARKGRLAITADGMGGAAGGYLASRIAVEVIREEYLSSTIEDPLEALGVAVQCANRTIFDRSREDSEIRGMGTTITAVVLLAEKVFIAHVGDTRAYLIRDGALTPLTTDHTRVGRLVEEGVITDEEAKERTDTHVLSRALGTDALVDVDLKECPFTTCPGDRLLICSDGLHGQVQDDEMLTTCCSLDPQAACDELVRLANLRGGPDNITVQILLIDEEPGATGAQLPDEDLEEGPAADRDPVQPGSRKFFLGLLVGLLAGFILFSRYSPLNWPEDQSTRGYDAQMLESHTDSSPGDSMQVQVRSKDTLSQAGNYQPAVQPDAADRTDLPRQPAKK